MNVYQILILVAAFNSCFLALGPAVDDAAVIDRFENRLKSYANKDRSISAAIVKGDRVVWSKAFGVFDTDNNSEADTSTIYRTGSISKSFTAFLMMELAEDGLIKLDDPVELHLPEIKRLYRYSEVSKITLRQLATHTSGLEREPQLEGAASGPIGEWENKISKSIPTTAFEYKPGEKFSYSNIGYGILGLALSRAANKPFIQLIEERIFKPLHMSNSYFIVPKEKLPHLSKGIITHRGFKKVVDRETPQSEHAGRGYKVPNGGIYSTPNDLAKFMICFTGNAKNLLTEKSLDLMQTATTIDETGAGYGLGFFLNREGLSTIVSHGGYVSGYIAHLAFDKNHGFGVIILKNYSHGDPDVNVLAMEFLAEYSSL